MPNYYQLKARTLLLYEIFSVSYLKTPLEASRSPREPYEAVWDILCRAYSDATVRSIT